MLHKTIILILLFVTNYNTSTNAQSNDPFLRYVEPAETKEISDEDRKKMIKYPKFNDFLQEKLDFSVPIISVEELKQLRKENPSLIVLDTRSAIAYNVSHIPKAKRVGYTDFSIERVWMIPRNSEVVVYCTVGYKSENIGNYLKNMGFTNVQNLYGSIVEWVNEGGIVINNKNEKTKKVVVGDKEKSRYLKKGHAIIVEQSELTQ